MHSNKQIMLRGGVSNVWRLSGLLIIGVLILTACSSPSGTSGTVTAVVPGTGSTATVAAPAAGSPTVAATTAATSAATAATTGTAAATSAATGAAGTGTPSASTTAPASIALTVKTSPSAGQYLADDKGMALYVFANDKNGASACTGQCASIWPPLIVTKGGQVTITGGGDSSKLGTITRAEGTTQVTYNNQPLYYYAKDKAPGDTNGQGVGGVWSLAKP